MAHTFLLVMRDHFVQMPTCHERSPCARPPKRPLNPLVSTDYFSRHKHHKLSNVGNSENEDTCILRSFGSPPPPNKSVVLQGRFHSTTTQTTAIKVWMYCCWINMTYGFHLISQTHSLVDKYCKLQSQGSGTANLCLKYSLTIIIKQRTKTENSKNHSESIKGRKSTTQ